MANRKNAEFITYFAAVPLFGTVLAAAYDVGYFIGFDISFYTFFSLSEHLMFVLEAIPLGQTITLAILGLISLIGVLVAFSKTVIWEINKRAKGASNDYEHKGVTSKGFD